MDNHLRCLETAAYPGWCCSDGWQQECVCPDVERGIRYFIDHDAETMTDEQREACLIEIESVEGYSRAECESLGTSDLARTVIRAWTDYARDKGFI